MTRDFFDFVSRISGGNCHELWRGSQVEKLEIHRHKMSWRFYISVEEPIPHKILLKTVTLLSQSLEYVGEIDIVPMLKDSAPHLEKIMYSHREEIMTQVFLSNQEVLNCLEFRFEQDRIDINARDNSAYQYLIEHEVCSKLSNWVGKKYALSVLVRVLCQEITVKQQIDTHLIPQKEIVLLTQPDDNKQKKRRTNSKGNREQNIKQSECIRIADLEEGLKKAVVEGEVWYKEINTLRDESVVITYYLSDYCDSIAVKSFLDGLDDDKIKIGDWIRVGGSVRYDNYMKEVVLFLDSYMNAEKPQRVDSAQQKRIELHVHTKMSAMDGLTEVTALIARAARWGHSAIAITDHGCTQAFPEAYQASQKYKIKVIYGVEGYLIEEDKKEKPFHIILLAANTTGLKNLYHLVSVSYLDNFYRHPKIPRSELIKYREGLLLGTACEAGELYRAILRGADESEIEKTASFYDYLEIQPLANNEFLLHKQDNLESVEDLQRINCDIVKLGKKLQKPVVATGDVHFLDPHHEIFRRIIQAGQGYDDAEEQAPLYLRTTDEMLEEFSYLGEEDARAVVIDNPMLIAGMTEAVKPVPDGFYPPKIDSAEEEVTDLTWEKAFSLYGENLPPVVEERVVRELDSITRHGFSVLYLIAHKLVQRSNLDGYLVGSRGSVGSSLVAYLTGITEVNPLPPHYLCPKCQHSEFIVDGSVACGADLEERLCPVCGTNMRNDGFDIPFETFLGFEGDKVPDIDLNFSGDYQSRAHQYVEELFGRENVYRAGTISTIAEKTAYGFVKKYMEAKQVHMRNAEINRLVKGITGVRRTTGQHPGGLIVVPQDKDILDFTPLQHPADKKDSGVVTTHFEYHAIGDQLVKLDILGHDDPTVIKELEDLCKIKASAISLSETETMKIFSSVVPLGVKPEDIGSSVGTFGIPEFGTRFVRQMLEATRPTTFSELVRISGLSHGTNVWLNNAHDLIKNETATLNEVICTRDDIMTYLIHQGLDKKQSFKIMEKIRKGKGLTSEEAGVMSENKVPSWYIDSCQKIEYMFPKAHAVAYVTMAFRIAYFKVYYPLQFYASFFSIRAEDFDCQSILAGYSVLRERIRDIEKAGMSASQKDRKLLPVLELAMEMYARGFEFYPVDIYKSEVSKFIVHQQGLLLPFSALPSVGIAAAQGIVESRDGNSFNSVEDFQQRTHLNKTAMEVLRTNNCFKDLPESSQISLFV